MGTCGPAFGILGGQDVGLHAAGCCSPALQILGGVLTVPGSEVLQVSLPASSFMTDARSNYDGLVAGTGHSMYVAVPGRGAVPNRAFYFTQSDGTDQIGLNPQLLEPVTLAGYTMVAVPLAAGLQPATVVATALVTAVSAFVEYTVTNLGAGVVSIEGNINSLTAFTGGAGAGNADAATNRGASGLWGMRLSTPNTFGSYGSGGVTVCAAQHATAPALGSTVVEAIDVFVGGVHNAGDQFRLALYEGGSGVSPVGATLLHDFGQITGTAINTWVRRYATSLVAPANASNLWLLCKSALGLTVVGGVFTASGGQGNLTDQEFYTTSIAASAAVAFPATVPIGGATSGSTFIFALRVIYKSSPYALDGSWVRTFGVHVPITAAPNTAAINSQLMMGATPPAALGMRLVWIDMPYGAVHSVAGGQYRVGVHQGGVLLNPNTAPIVSDLGQTTGTAINTFVRMTAPISGDPGEVSISNTTPLWWSVKNNVSGVGGSEVAYAIGNAGGIAAASPNDNPMDWITPAGVGTGSEYELSPANPSINTDPAVAFPATVTTDASDTLPGNIPFGRIGLRINGIRLTAIP